MRLLDFLAAVFVATIVWPHSAPAQQPERLRRIGVLLISNACPTPPALIKSLAALGWVQDRTVTLDCMSAVRDLEQLPTLAAELVARRPDVVVSQYVSGARVLKATTATIPIVMLGVADPVREGLVQSLSRPGGNMTGLTSVIFELERKRIQILKDVVPNLTRLAVIGRLTNDPYYSDIDKLLVEAARTHGFVYRWFRAAHVEDYPRLFREIAVNGFDAVYLVPNPLLDMEPALVGGASQQSRLPTMGATAELANGGVLFTYGPSFEHRAERGAAYIDKILRGARPADLPFEQPTKFELIVNLKTAKALKLTIPQSILLRADRVIE